MTGLLDGRVVLVTGAGRGLGRAHALELAGHGARVVVNDIGVALAGGRTGEDPAADVVAEIRAAGGTAVACHDDIATWAGAAAAVDRGIAEFGALDGLVANAGVLRKVELADLAEEDLDVLVGVHLRGTAACLRHALRYWRDRHERGEPRDAAVVTTFSEAAVVSLPGYTVYGGVKAAIAQLTTTASREAARYGVRVNGYAPRAATRMRIGVDTDETEGPWATGATSPLVAWLLSGRARGVTGRLFQTVGGAVAPCTQWATGEYALPRPGRHRLEVDELDGLLTPEWLGPGLGDPVLAGLVTEQGRPTGEGGTQWESATSST
ncbi:SDR family NAD(P)-dependent oxidoreductase [Pseudonocardia xishanensis]|uniref:SDR family oxidoreductase n=1 Tax=Pseudonocardia xishanensis TaxID=630995 RepID=A0ABP8RRK2_9PSEU